MAYIFFSSFWAWLGTLILLLAIFGGCVNIVTHFQSHRRVKISQTGSDIVVEIENATKDDIDTALADIKLSRKDADTDD